MNGDIVLSVLAKGFAGNDDLHEINSTSEEPRRNDSSHRVASLDILQRETEVDECLLVTLERNPIALKFFKFTANYWPARFRVSSLFDLNQWRGSLHVVASLLSISMMIALFFWMVVLLLAFIYFRATAVTVILYVTMCVDVLCVLIAQYLNHQRLRKPPRIHDKTVTDESLRIAKYVGAACISTAFASMLVTVISQSFGFEGTLGYVMLLGLGGLCISLSMTFNMFFLIMDLKVSSLLLDQLLLLADKRRLTVKVFNKVRDEIHRRVDDSKFASDFIIAPCALSTLAIAMLIFHSISWELSLGLVLNFLKELIFISVAFWYVAKVNGKADAITLKLSRESWLAVDRDEHQIEEEEKGAVSPQDDEYERSCMTADLHRLSVYATACAEPISFTLLFKRVSWENVVLSAAGVVVTFVVGIIKGLVNRIA